jgi:hypothetical protein
LFPSVHYRAILANGESACRRACKNYCCSALTRTVVPALTKETAAAAQDQARWLQPELGQSLTGFQNLMLTMFGTVRDGIDGQVRGFDQWAAGIAAKLNDDMAQMRSANRDSPVNF